ncbi:MAG: MFS transporter, partial [Anaerolineales bacterium]|nr:MFS transporter [Anaerolineales bacterium]
MSEKRTGYRAFVIVVFFLFVLLHQTDKLLIGSMQLPVSETFGLNDLQWGFINTGALIVGTIFYPLWGYLYDRYARAKLLALASFIWGATTWLSAVVRTYPQFLVTRSSTGVDDSSYPGLYSLAADYFGPKLRGRVYGILQLAQPIGYLLGMILALMVAPNLDGLIFRLEGWRTIFLFTGLLGIA